MFSLGRSDIWEYASKCDGNLGDQIQSGQIIVGRWQPQRISATGELQEHDARLTAGLDSHDCECGRLASERLPTTCRLMKSS